MTRLSAALLLACALAAPARAERIEDIPNPRAGGVWVVDLADVVTSLDETAINSRLDDLARENGAEVALVTVRRVSEYDPKRFATELFNRWGIGVKGADNGVLVLFSRGDRRIEIETGYGAEGSLTDGEAGAILDRYAVPAFKRNDYSRGLYDTIFAVATEMREGEPAFSKVTRSVGVPPRVAVFGLVGLLGCALLGFLFWLARRPPRCSRCGEPMRELTAAQEKAYLQGDRAYEEQIGSVNHVVFRCDDDQEITIQARNKWFSGYTGCNRCGRRTASRSTRTIRYASYTHGGLEEITERCSLPRCRHVHSFTRSTPRKTRPQTSSSSSYSSSSSSWSSSGSSSFGGGSSGGGGAGRSW